MTSQMKALYEYTLISALPIPCTISVIAGESTFLGSEDVTIRVKPLYAL